MIYNEYVKGGTQKVENMIDKNKVCEELKDIKTNTRKVYAKRQNTVLQVWDIKE